MLNKHEINEIQFELLINPAMPNIHFSNDELAIEKAKEMEISEFVRVEKVEVWRILYWSDWNAMLEAKMKLLRG